MFETKVPRKLKTTIIQAEAGWSVLYFHAEPHVTMAEHVDVVSAEPIIAWAVTVAHDANAALEDDDCVDPESIQVVPILAFGQPGVGLPLRAPDGRVKIGYDHWLVPEDEAKEEWLREEITKRKKAAA